MTREDRIKLAKAVYTKRIRKELTPLNYFEPIDHPELQQKQFLESEKKNIAAFGGNRSGKSLSGAIRPRGIMKKRQIRQVM